MAIKQRLQDLGLQLRESRKAKVILVGVVLAVVFVMFSGQPKHRMRVSSPVDKVQGSAALGRDEIIRDMTTAITDRLDRVDLKTKQIGDELQDLRTDQKTAETRTAEIFRKVIERMNSTSQQPGADGKYPSPVDYQGSAEVTAEVDALEPFGDVHAPEVTPPPLPDHIERVAYIGSADSVRVKLLAGVNAPTDGTPYPVIFQLSGDVQGPDGSALPLGEARLIAAAQGSLTDSRALFRLTTLSMRYPDGRRKDIDVDGWIVGEDGIRGMQGVLIDPLGKVLGAAVLTGTVGGLGSGISRSQTSVTTGSDGQAFEYVDGNVASYALGQGVSTGARDWSRIIQERVRKLTPAVQVFSGREATAIFAKPVAIPGLYEALQSDESDVFPSF